MDTIKMDATSPTPKTARDVRLGDERYSRNGLESAWLLLAEHNGDRRKAIVGMQRDGWVLAQAIEFVRAAEQWTGEIVLPDGIR